MNWTVVIIPIIFYICVSQGIVQRQTIADILDESVRKHFGLVILAISTYARSSIHHLVCNAFGFAPRYTGVELFICVKDVLNL